MSNRARTRVCARAGGSVSAGTHALSRAYGHAEAVRNPARRQRKPGRTGKPSSQPQAAPPVSRNAALHRDQVLRVGLTADRERAVLSGSAAFRVLDAATRKPVWKESYGEPLTVGIRGARPTEGRIYRAQIGSFEREPDAQERAARLRGEIGEPVVVAWSPDRKVWRIRVGEGSSREALTDVLTRLRAAGYADAWITDEPVPQTEKASLVLLDARYESYPITASALALEPVVSGGLLAVNGESYRGTLEVRLDAAGGLRVVNVVPVESYLRGVVPSEMGPGVYPELEALKAQAVAARTYAYRNMGQFAAEGYDLCDTPRCQVYGGAKAEQPLSDRAILETEGVIATFRGDPINSLYTSTCGGHTEDAEEIFPEQAAPYLSGVPCAPEQRARKARRIVVAGDPALVQAPAAAAEAASLLAVHGILPGAAGLGAAELSRPVPEAEARLWIEAAGSACGLGKPGASSGGVKLSALARQIVERLGWQERVDLLIKREDPLSWFAEEPEGMPDEEAGAVAYFLREKAWPEAESGKPDPQRTASRGDLARLLLFAARECGLLHVSEGIVRGGSASELELSGKSGQHPLRLSEQVRLFADFGAGPVPVRRLGLVTGDKVLYHVDEGSGSSQGRSARKGNQGGMDGESEGPTGPIDELLLLPGRQGLSDDRYSAVSSWRVAYSAEELTKRLEDSLGSTGQLLDILLVRRGVSGRVTEIKMVGSKGQGTVTGFRIRTILGLKENLFTVDKQRDAAGALRRIVFTGRGWGHGVGMCQVGAYGMALRGSLYPAILSHYYSGIVLERLP